jgi:hypothetical protein
MRAAFLRLRIPDTIQRTYGAVGFRLIDDLTGDFPLGQIRCTLFAQDGPGRWRLVDREPVRTMSGVLVFPDLGRSAAVQGVPPIHYRAVIEAEYYRPFYAAHSDGIEFDVFPFNDDNPPTKLVTLPQDVVLVPAPTYPFSAYLRVLRGQVQDNSARPVADAEVSLGNAERVLSDQNGAFALPLHLSPRSGSIKIDAIDHRTARQGDITINLPDDLSKIHPITIT